MCTLSWDPPYRYPFTSVEEHAASWRLGAWDQGEPLYDVCQECFCKLKLNCHCGTRAYWGNTPFQDLLSSDTILQDSAMVEIEGWGRIISDEKNWVAKDTYPLSLSLWCLTCLSHGRLGTAETIVAAPNFNGDDVCYTGEGCCKQHLSERLEALENRASELIPLSEFEEEIIESIREDCRIHGSLGYRRGLKNVLVRLFRASEVEADLLAQYQLDDGGSPVRQSSNVPRPPASLQASRPSQLHGLEKVAGMLELKNLLWKDVIRPLRDPAPFKRYGLTIPNGILLFGPPGCGKTYIARQLAEELGFAFIELIPSEVASPYIHDSVLRIRAIFEKAEGEAPSVIFIDEFEALVPSRADLGGHQQYKSEEVNEFLAHLNSCADKKVLIVAATNEPQKIDAAILRTG